MKNVNYIPSLLLIIIDSEHFPWCDYNLLFCSNAWNLLLLFFSVNSEVNFQSKPKLERNNILVVKGEFIFKQLYHLQLWTTHLFELFLQVISKSYLNKKNG